MPLVVKPLSPALGAEIAGIDLRQDLSAETFAEIRDIWHKNLVILFRGQSLSEDDQIRFAQRFGELQKRTRPPEAINEAGHTKYPQLTMLVSNIRENGKLIGSLPQHSANPRYAPWAASPDSPAGTANFPTLYNGMVARVLRRRSREEPSGTASVLQDLWSLESGGQAVRRVRRTATLPASLGRLGHLGLSRR